MNNEAAALDMAGAIDAVLGGNGPAMGLDDLARNAQAKAGMGAEFLMLGTLRIKAAEYGFQIVGRNTRPLVLDNNQDGTVLGDGAQL